VLIWDSRPEVKRDQVIGMMLQGENKVV